MPFKNRKIIYLAWLLLSSVLLLIPAFYNHYPLVNPDTATYLASGFKPETPFDRPITYGLLIRFFSLNGVSLWLVIAAQAYLVSWLISKVFRLYVGDNVHQGYVTLSILFLSLFTPLSWIVSQVQPDVFTSVVCLCILIILSAKAERRNKVIAYVIFFISVGVHMSHPVLFVAVSLSLFLLKRLFIPEDQRTAAVKAIGIMAALSIFSIVFMGSALSKSKNAFLVASLMDKGILKTFLDENCSKNEFRLCAYKDSLTMSSDGFLWDGCSPLYKLGGWLATKTEFSMINHQVFTSPHYLGQFMVATFHRSISQAVTFNIGDGNTSFPPGSNVQLRVASYFPQEMKAFDRDWQNNTEIRKELLMPNRLFMVIAVLSLSVGVFVFGMWRRMSIEIKTMWVVTLVVLFGNILDCAAFSVVIGRYGCKMIWMLPFCALVLLPDLLGRRVRIA